MITDFRHCCIAVKDLDRAIKFYKDILGLEVIKILSVSGKCPETLLGIKGIRLTYAKMKTLRQSRKSPPVFELHCWQKPRKTLSKNIQSHISFTVKDIDYEYKRLKGQGVKFISTPLKVPYTNTKICFGYDPDNNLIEFVEDLPEQVKIHMRH